MKSIFKAGLLFALLFIGFFFISNPGYSKTNDADIPAGENPYGIAINPDTDVAVVANEKSASVSIIDLNTQEVLSEILVGKAPRGVAIDRGLNIALVGSNHDGIVSVIDLDTYNVISNIPVGKAPEGMAVDPITHTALIANHKDNSVSVIDLRSYSVAGEVSVGREPLDIAIDPGLRLALVVNEKDWSVSVIDLETYQVTNTIPVGKKPKAIDINSETHSATVANAKDNSITIINLLDLKTETIAIGKHPVDVVINPLDNRALVICNDPLKGSGDRNLLIIDLDTNEIVENYGLNKLPRGVAVNPYTNIAGIVDDKTYGLALIQLPNPVPYISSMEPDTLYRGSKSARIALTGSKFIKTSTVSINSDTASYSVSPIFIDNHFLEVDVPEEILKSTGIYQLTVTNPAPDGGTSNAVELQVVNPVPQISVLDPLEAAAGTQGLELSIHGTGFFPETEFYVNGEPVDVTYHSHRKATLDLTALDLEYGRHLEITAYNPPPGGGLSSDQTFTVLNPIPALSSLSPDSITAGSPDFTLALTGDNYVKTSLVDFNGQQFASSFISSTQIEATIPKEQITQPGDFNVAVVNPAPGGGVSASLPFTVKPPLEIKITSPGDGDTVDRAKVMVRGTVMSGTGDIGITVNGILAEISGNNWVANSVPLAVGENTIGAVVTDSNGNTASDEITVFTNEIVQPVTLSANLTSGIAPLMVYFSVYTDMPNPITGYQMDFEGDGVVDYEGMSFEDVSHTYETEGIFYPTVTVIDNQGNAYSDTIAVTVLSKEAMDTLLKEKWDGMNSALARGDIEEAVINFSSESQGLYNEQFTSLKSVLPAIAEEMSSAQIYLVSVENNTAKYEVLTTRKGKALSFHLMFVRDINGLWKIWRF